MDPRVESTIEYLGSGPGRATIATLAKRVGLGASRLEHLFKRDIGTSIRDYVTERRLSAAATRLRGSNERVSEIAWKVGYTDSSNFTHAFKKRFGASPSAYRRHGAPPYAAGDGRGAMLGAHSSAGVAQPTNTLQIGPRNSDCPPDPPDRSLEQR